MSTADLKIVLLGQKNVGKTSMFNRYIYDHFGQTSMTIGAYFAIKQIKIDDRAYSLAIWDTAGEEKFDSLTNFYCRNAKAALICYDVTNSSTFENISKWVSKLTTEADKCVIMLVGNKVDLVHENGNLRSVDFEAARRYAQSIGADVMESSAKSGFNVNDIFETVVRRYLAQGNISSSGPNDMVPLNTKPANSGRCC